MYKKFILAFSSLTLATCVNAFACGCGDNNVKETVSVSHSDDTDMMSNPERMGKNEHMSRVHEKPNDAFDTSEDDKDNVRTYEYQTKRVRDMNHTVENADNTRKTLGYLQTDTVLPTPSHHYDYEEVRQKELVGKSHKHSIIKKVRTIKLVGNDVINHNSDIKNNSITQSPRAVNDLKHDDGAAATDSLDEKASDAPMSEQLNIKTTSPSEAGLKAAHPAPVESSHAAVNNRVSTLEYHGNELEISDDNQEVLDQVVEKFKDSKNKTIKIQSYAYSKGDEGDSVNKNESEDARRNAFQRALKVRKYLVDKDIDATNISVNAVEDVESKLNHIEISFEDIKQ